MKAVSEVFSEFWNLIMSKAARPSRLVSEVITSLSLSIQSFPYLFLQIDQYPPPLRPQFTTPSIQSVNLHTPTPATFLVPLRSRPLVTVPPYNYLISLLSTCLTALIPCFHDRFSQTFFRFLCLFLPSPPLPTVSSDVHSPRFGSRPLIKRPSTTSYPSFPSLL